MSTNNRSTVGMVWLVGCLFAFFFAFFSLAQLVGWLVGWLLALVGRLAVFIVCTIFSCLVCLIGSNMCIARDVVADRHIMDS